MKSKVAWWTSFCCLFISSLAPSLVLIKDEKITAYPGQILPMSNVLRHLVFQGEAGLQYDIYKQELSRRPQPDFQRRVIELLSPNASLLELTIVRDVLAAENGDDYDRKVIEWLEEVEKAESGREWPPHVLQRLRQSVLRHTHLIDYVVATRTTGNRIQTVATLRRTVSGEYYRFGSDEPVQPRVPLILEDVFDVRLIMPRIMVSPDRRLPVSGGEISELGGYWIADGENKFALSQTLLSLLFFTVDDTRVPEPFREKGRRWVNWTDAPGNRLFHRRFGFEPLQESHQHTEGETTFYFGQVTAGGLRQTLLDQPCGPALLEAVAAVHEQAAIAGTDF